MKSPLPLIVLALLLIGCHKPIQTQSRMTLNPTPALREQPLVPMRVDGPAVSEGPKIALIDVDGLLLNNDMSGLYSQGENPVAVFHEKLDAAAADGNVRAVVLRLNSYGGGVTASDMMWHDLSDFKARCRRPLVACCLDVTTGGAYYLATASDVIVAHPTSITGGIGVILNLYNLQDSMAQFNVVGAPIKSGENVDLGSPITARSEEAQALLQAMADQFHDRFRHIVERSRKIAAPPDGDVFDGRVFTAGQAQTLGLIDQIGYLDDAIAIARSMAGVPNARVVVFHRKRDRARTPYDQTPNTPLQSTLLPISIPGLDRTRLPTFLYVWQPEPTIERLSGK